MSYLFHIYQGTIDSSNAEKNRLTSLLKDMNLRGVHDQAAANYLKESYDIQNRVVKESTESKEKQEDILQVLKINFIKKCTGKHSQLLALLAPMTIAIREELETDGDSAAFAKALDDNVARMIAAFDKLFAELDTEKT